MKIMKKNKKYKARFVYPLITYIGKKIEKKHFPGEPIMILGSPRSGTTLLLSILAAHPSIFAIPKQTYAFDVWTENNGMLMPARIDRLYREFIIRKIPASATRWLEKTPRHVQNLDKILKYFDNKIKIIHLIRDGRDVVVSKHPAYMNRRKYWVSVERWTGDVKFAYELSKHSSNIYNVKYEDLITNYDNEIVKLFEFLGEEYSEELKAWYKNTTIKKSKHWGDKVQNIHSKAIGKWKNDEHKERMEEFYANPEAVALLKQLNYE